MNACVFVFISSSKGNPLLCYHICYAIVVVVTAVAVAILIYRSLCSSSDGGGILDVVVDVIVVHFCFFFHFLLLFIFCYQCVFVIITHLLKEKYNFFSFRPLPISLPYISSLVIYFTLPLFSFVNILYYCCCCYSCSFSFLIIISWWDIFNHKRFFFCLHVHTHTYSYYCRRRLPLYYIL